MRVRRFCEGFEGVVKVWRFCLNLKQKAVFFGFPSGFCDEQDGTALTFTGSLARVLGLPPTLLISPIV